MNGGTRVSIGLNGETTSTCGDELTTLLGEMKQSGFRN